jgi:spore germination cell wall hydrolase CwlJ-like protein
VVFPFHGNSDKGRKDLRRRESFRIVRFAIQPDEHQDRDERERHQAGTSFDAVMRDTDAEGDLMYLARLVYSEATSNSPDDMYAVASVVINRMKRPELGMGTTIKDVIDKPGAFNGRTSERFDAITKGFYHIADVKNWNQSLDAAGKP